MRIKSTFFQWLAVASFVVGLLYALGIEGGAQVGQPITDGEFITAVVLILLAIFFMRLGFAAHDREKAQGKKIHQPQKNTVKSRRKAG